jgi:hypothetical protein
MTEEMTNAKTQMPNECQNPNVKLISKSEGIGFKLSLAFYI